MARLTDRLVDFWDWSRRVTGFDRVSKEKRREIAETRGRIGQILFYARPALALLVILYLVSAFTRLSLTAGDELGYPQRVISGTGAEPGSRLPDGSGCAPSQTVAVTSYILDVLVNQNVWAPGDPQYKFGWFGIWSFESGPFFDNKASFQIGALRAVRRIGVEAVDLLGRARGTSAPDSALTDARGALQWNERAWIINPFSQRLPLLSNSAAATFRDAKESLDIYNLRLTECAALFDARSDNLFQLLDRIANDIGGMTDQLASRSKGERWDPATKAFVPGDGNNNGIFDFRADNLFYEAHGMMWAYHGILQAMRLDFADVVRQSNLDQIWDRMETHIAESAGLAPIIVSNGREDSLFQPDHLSAMAVNMLRARANMTELREILNR
ncbi:MAG: DUF2333 family protein [Rubrimonas sp.]|uniref:DUF2333 family protein n=1 Tax=Rubrimonas sp. TaxID=2036015 RepID=UPI002FDC8A84